VVYKRIKPLRLLSSDQPETLFTGKQHSKLVIIFSQTSVDDFSKTKPTFDNSKRVLNLCSDTGFDLFRLEWLLVLSWSLPPCVRIVVA
jgi:hypothetical protein